jgi:hypothetical protein
VEQLSRWSRWLLAASVGVLSIFVGWVLYVFGSLVVFTLAKVQLPASDSLPVLIGFGVVAFVLMTLLVGGRLEQHTAQRHDRAPYATRWAVAAAVVLALVIVTPVVVAEAGEARFLSKLPPTWDKQMALDLGHRECAWLEDQPWGEPGQRAIGVEHLMEMRGHRLSRRGVRQTEGVLRRARYYLCPFQGFVHRNDFDPNDRPGDGVGVGGD